MKPNFWLYRTSAEQAKTAGPLILFGADVAMKATVIQGIEELRGCTKALKANQQYDTDLIALKYGLDYLVDSVRILIFFENYMKAELLVRNFCVHSVDNTNSNRPDLVALAKKQTKEPIYLYEVRDVEPFVGDDSFQTLFNPGLKETTLGMNILLKPSYLEYYAFDDEILRFIKNLNVSRNKLHFHSKAEFTLSEQFIDDLERVRSFVLAMAYSLGKL